MKTKILLGLAGLVVGVTMLGCVDTVSDRKTPGVPFMKDTIEDRYERPVEQVHRAAIDVIKFNGTLVNESVLYSETNQVKTVEGRINQRNVWVRVEQVDPKVTSVKVQTRTPGGTADIDLAHAVATQIAVKLATR
jgi:hypothetical protein